MRSCPPSSTIAGRRVRASSAAHDPACAKPSATARRRAQARARSVKRVRRRERSSTPMRSSRLTISRFMFPYREGRVALADRRLLTVERLRNSDARDAVGSPQCTPKMRTARRHVLVGRRPAVALLGEHELGAGCVRHASGRSVSGEPGGRIRHKFRNHRHGTSVAVPFHRWRVSASADHHKATILQRFQRSPSPVRRGRRIELSCDHKRRDRASDRLHEVLRTSRHVPRIADRRRNRGRLVPAQCRAGARCARPFAEWPRLGAPDRCPHAPREAGP